MENYSFPPQIVAQILNSYKSGITEIQSQPKKVIAYQLQTQVQHISPESVCNWAVEAQPKSRNSMVCVNL